MKIYHNRAEYQFREAHPKKKEAAKPAQRSSLASAADPKKVEAAKPAQRSYLARAAAEPSKRKLVDSSSPSDDEGKLFEDFFNKPKKTYTSKTPERRKKKFFTHTRGPPPPSF